VHSPDGEAVQKVNLPGSELICHFGFFARSNSAKQSFLSFCLCDFFFGVDDRQPNEEIYLRGRSSNNASRHITIEAIVQPEKQRSKRFL
jgi:hypothetical protein